MIVVFLAYLLLAAPLHGAVRASFHAPEGEVQISLNAAGIVLTYYASLTNGENGWSLQTVLNALNILKTQTSCRGKWRKALRSAIRSVVRINVVRLNMRIGLENAWQTALAAGTAKASAYGALSVLPSLGSVSVCVIPDYSASCFCAGLQCIFCVSAGDIMFSAAKAMIRRAAEKGRFHAAASH